VTNYDFCADFSQRVLTASGRVLDYGCGQGTTVEILRARKVSAYGCDVFYDGGNYRQRVDAALLREGIVRHMTDDRIPFSDGFFDVVVSNQVFEHVPDLHAVLAEISRVLRPGGVLLSLFPDASCWREGHCGVPFLHWFKAQSALRVYYATSLRLLGFGLHKEDKTPLQWSRQFCEWIDAWTHYRRYDEIKAAFAMQFSPMRHIEGEWLQIRLGKTIPYVPDLIKSMVVRKWVGLVFWCTKTESSERSPAHL
jgi:SAM-dependent methyltransferase